MVFAVVAAVSMTQVASAQVGRAVIAVPGFIARGVQGPGFVTGSVQTPFRVRRGFVASTPNGFASGGQVATPLGNDGVINAAVKVTRTHVGPAGNTVEKTVRIGAHHTNVKTKITRPNGNSVTVRPHR